MKRYTLVLSVAVLGLATSAFADTYVGSWEVDQGPAAFPVPPAYTGQEAAALIFGGSPSDYIITTVFGSPNLADAWYSTWGGACGGSFPCGTVLPDNTVVSTGGLYANPGDQSAYVSDWAQGSQYTNYAYSLVSTPEPGALALLGFVLIAMAGALRRKFIRPN